ncbi:MAG: acyl-CoA dehydrogenase [Actinobacteria bacterium]|nr:MAG: acyl-CoA dehydrogenase [Actinomycetota bacterium]RIK07927.1 MAG: acyl-CoA dehydrogenase [Acidobacteriota bacterium]
MDFRYPIEAEEFRGEFRAWLESHLEERFVGLGFEDLHDPAALATMREWNRLLADAGYAAIHWPEEYGGRGAGLIEQQVFAEEMSRADAPGTLNPIGISNIAPAILAFGSEGQKRKLLPRMLRGDDIWCQGFSEPDAGSDLASLITSASRDGDHYVVRGQKVWTTLGHLADWCELLVRTDPDAPRHEGISCLLVDMSLPGIEVRPLVTATGSLEFDEIFFDGVEVPLDALLGEENSGWTVAVTTLANERAGVASLHLQVRKKVQKLIETAHQTRLGSTAAAEDASIRRRLAEVYLQAEYLKLLSDRAVSGQVHGRPFGPESSIAKLVWSDLEQDIARLAGEIQGLAANSGEWGRERVYARALSIAGGTTQVNKNIVARHVLGLPRE